MPRIIVISDGADGDPQVLWSERIHAANLASHHFRVQLAERLGWAVEDAHRLEQAVGRSVADGLSRGAGALGLHARDDLNTQGQAGRGLT